ncbi:MAG: TrkA C-terminal domain-containing protein [Nitrospirales bacterium]
MLHRLRREFTITTAAVREGLFAVAEQVNRKVQALKLHWEAATQAEQMDGIYQGLGAQLSQEFGKNGSSPDPEGRMSRLDQWLKDATARLRPVQEQLARITARIRVLEDEALVQELVSIHQFLSRHGATMERVTVRRGARAVGQSPQNLGLPAAVRLAAVFRGPTPLILNHEVTLKDGDVVLLMGPRQDVQAIRGRFVAREPTER